VYRWFQSRALTARDVEGRITGCYILLTDIDDRKRAEGELVEARIDAPDRRSKDVVANVGTEACQRITP